VAENPTKTGPYDIHSEARGKHWVAWVTRGDSAKPDRSILIVAANQQDAETHARQWVEQSSY
jgi:hypothetical protein